MIYSQRKKVEISEICTQDCTEPYEVSLSHGNVSSDDILIGASFMECDWTFTGFHGSHVKLEFVKFDLPRAVGKGFCDEAFVMYGGYSYEGRRVIQEKVCGSLLPQTFVSGGGNAWLSYTLTGLFQNRWFMNGTLGRNGFTVQYTMTRSRHFENQLIVGLTCGLVLPICCCVPLCFYVRKLKKRKLKELAETDQFKKLQKKEELRRMLLPIKRNKWQRMSLRRKAVLKSAKNFPNTQPRKRRRLSGTGSPHGHNWIHPTAKFPQSITSDIYEDIAQYVDPEEIHPLSSGNFRRKKSVKHKNMNLIKRIRSSADNTTHTYISLTDIHTNAASQGSARGYPWSVTSEGLHSSTPVSAKPASGLLKHPQPAGQTDQYFTGEGEEMKPSPVSGTLVHFVKSETDTGTSTDCLNQRQEMKLPKPVVTDSRQYKPSQYTDETASDENNNISKLWLPKVIITQHREESSSQSMSFKRNSIKEKKLGKLKVSQPDQDSSTLSDSYRLDSTKEKAIDEKNTSTSSQKPKARLRVAGIQPKLRSQSMKKRPRPIKEEESTESCISTDPTDQSESDHSVQNVDWSFEDPRHLSLIKECLEETDRATSFETMIRSQENISAFSRSCSNKIDNIGCSINKNPRGQITESSSKEEFPFLDDNLGMDYITVSNSNVLDFPSKHDIEDTTPREAVSPSRKREGSSSWEFSPGIFTKIPKFDFTNQKDLKEFNVTNTAIQGIRPLKENKEEKLTSFTHSSPATSPERIDCRLQYMENPTVIPDQLNDDEFVHDRNITGPQNTASDVSTVEGSPSEWSYRKVFMKTQSAGNDGGNEVKTGRRYSTATEHALDLVPQMSPMSSDISLTQSVGSKTQRPKLPLDSFSGLIHRIPSFESVSQLDNSIFSDSCIVKDRKKPVSDMTYIVPSVPLFQQTESSSLDSACAPISVQQDITTPYQDVDDMYIMKETAL